MVTVATWNHLADSDHALPVQDRPEGLAWRAYAGYVDPIEVRRRIGVVFQKPNPFPRSAYDIVVTALASTASQASSTKSSNRRSSTRRYGTRSRTN